MESGRKGWRWILLMALGWFANVGCDGGTPLYIELTGSDGASEYFLAPTEANQAGGDERLAALAPGGIAHVEYNILPRQSPFLLVGDLAEGSPLLGLQLPQPATGEQTFSFDVGSNLLQWSSFRVYDRGECSQLLGWQGVTEELSTGLVGEMGSSDYVRGAELRLAHLTPVLRSRFPTAEAIPPDDVDELTLRLRMHADRIGSRIIATSCGRVDLTIELEIAVEPTDVVWFAVSGRKMANNCSGSSKSDVREAISAGRLPECDPEDDIKLDGLGTVPLSDVDRYLLAGEFSGHNDDNRVLLGFSDAMGHRLGGHDVLARIQRLGIEDFDAFECRKNEEDRIKDLLEESLRRKLVLGLWDAIVGGTTFDPFLAGLANGTACDKDKDCRPNLPDQPPAYTTDAGDFRGIRHACKTRNKEGLKSLVGDDSLNPIIDRLRDGKFCFFAFEPDRLNVRPDGLEVVLMDDSSEDPQADQYSLLEGQVCEPKRAGFLEADRDPLTTGTGVPIRFIPED